MVKLVNADVQRLAFAVLIQACLKIKKKSRHSWNEVVGTNELFEETNPYV
jgi:hypothetical protein